LSTNSAELSIVRGPTRSYAWRQKNVRQGYTGEPRGATSEILTRSRCQRRFGHCEFLRINRNRVSHLASSNNPRNAESTANLLISHAMKILQVTCVRARRARLRKPTRVYTHIIKKLKILLVTRKVSSKAKSKIPTKETSVKGKKNRFHRTITIFEASKLVNNSDYVIRDYADVILRKVITSENLKYLHMWQRAYVKTQTPDDAAFALEDCIFSVTFRIFI